MEVQEGATAPAPPPESSRIQQSELVSRGSLRLSQGHQETAKANRSRMSVGRGNGQNAGVAEKSLERDVIGDESIIEATSWAMAVKFRRLSQRKTSLTHSGSMQPSQRYGGGVGLLCPLTSVYVLVAFRNGK